MLYIVLYKTLASPDDTQSFCIADVYLMVFNRVILDFLIVVRPLLSFFISIKWLPRRAQILYLCTLVADEAWAEVLIKSILVDFGESVFLFMFFQFLIQP